MKTQYLLHKQENNRELDILKDINLIKLSENDDIAHLNGRSDEIAIDFRCRY